MGKDVGLDLIQPVKADDLVTVQKILSKSSATNSKKPVGSLKLPNINQQDADGLSVLHHAALAGNHNMMKLLLEHGVKVDIKDNKGLRPLQYATWLGRVEPVEQLLQSSSDVNDPALDGATPLHLACEHGHSDVVEKLLAYKADPTLTNVQNKTPLDLACEFGRKRVVELLLACNLSAQLLSGCSDDVLENDKTTCLHLAARNGHVDVLKLLIDFGFNVNRQTPHGTCLHEAAKYGKTEVVRLLLSHGIDVSRLNSYEETALEIVNKFTATRAAKELKQLLKDASSEVLARAVKDYSKPNDASHLTFKEGDIIMVIDRFCKNGLWKGYSAVSSVHGTTHTGYFPSDTVVILSPMPPSIQIPVDSLNSCTNQCLANCISSSSSTHLVPVLTSSIHSVNNQQSEVNGDAIRLPPTSPTRTKSSSDVNRDSGFSANNSCIGHGFITAENVNGLQNRLSGQSSESGVSGLSSCQPSSLSPVSCSQSSLNQLDESSSSSFSTKAHELLPSDLPPDSEFLSTWLRGLHLEEYLQLFLNAGYDLPTVSRMTPEDLTAIGITQPSVRKKLKAEIAQLTIPSRIPDFTPKSVKEWLDILHLSEYYDQLMHQGYTDIDRILGIMWEDLEEIGIWKLGHQKKIMLAVDRLKKIAGGLQLQPLPSSNPMTPKSSLVPSGLKHYTSNLSQSSFMSQNNTFSESLNPVAEKSFCPSSKAIRQVNLNNTGNLIMSYSSPTDMSYIGSRSVHPTSAALRSSPYHVCCHSFQMRNCENFYQNDIIGPAPPLPCKRNYMMGVNSVPTKDGTLLFSKEMENLDLSHSQPDWFPSKRHVMKMKTKCQDMPFDTCHDAKRYHVSSYGTLPRGLSHKSKMAAGYGGVQNNFYDWYAAEKLPIESSLPNTDFSEFNIYQRKPLTPPKRMNSFKDDVRLFGIAGERLRSETSASKLCHCPGGRQLLDAVNLEGDYQNFSELSLSNLHHPRTLHLEKGFVNEVAAINCAKKAAAQSKYCDKVFKREFETNDCSLITENEDRADRNTSISSDSGLKSCENISSMSLNSSDSSGTFDGNTLPFANEDCGTIKERNSTSSTDRLSDMTSSEQTLVNPKEHDGSMIMSSKSLSSSDSNIQSNQDISHLLIQNGVKKNQDTQRCQNSASGQNNEAVFDDIDGMLLGLTQELDEMLKLQA